MRNETGIEGWILRKARDRSHRRTKQHLFIHMILVSKENLATSISIGKKHLMLSVDGLTWPIRDGTDEYALTREQLGTENLKNDNVPFVMKL